MTKPKGECHDVRSVLLYYFPVSETAREYGVAYMHATAWARRLGITMHRVGKEAYINPSDQRILRQALASRSYGRGRGGKRDRGISRDT